MRPIKEIAAIADDAERLRAITRLLAEVDEMMIELAQLRRATTLRLLQAAPVPEPQPDAVLTDDAQRVLDWVRRHEKLEFRVRDAFRHLQRHFPKVDDMTPALELLEMSGHIRRVRTPTAQAYGRARSPLYEVIESP